MTEIKGRREMINISNHFLRLLFLDYSLEAYKSCVQAGMNVGVNIDGLYVSVGGKGGSCDGLLNEMGGEV